VVWVAIAIGLAIAIIWFRVGVSFLSARWAREDGRLDVARFMRTFLVLLWTGVAFAIAGASLGVLALRVVGYTLWGCALLVQFSMPFVLHRKRRLKSTP
jgi:hypothetical protein